MRHLQPAPARNSAGFTLVELIIVMVLIGALAVFALPRLVDTEMWRLRAFGDELQSQMAAMLRLSLLQRRPVVATISGSGVAFAYAGGGAASADLACPATATPCIAESGARSITFNNANSGTSVIATGNALDTTLTITVSHGDYTRAFRLENETGLIYPLP